MERSCRLNGLSSNVALGYGHGALGGHHLSIATAFRGSSQVLGKEHTTFTGRKVGAMIPPSKICSIDFTIKFIVNPNVSYRLYNTDGGVRYAYGQVELTNQHPEDRVLIFSDKPKSPAFYTSWDQGPSYRPGLPVPDLDL
jgi:hypothetical protein